MAKLVTQTKKTSADHSTMWQIILLSFGVAVLIATIGIWFYGADSSLRVDTESPSPFAPTTTTVVAAASTPAPTVKAVDITTGSTTATTVSTPSTTGSNLVRTTPLSTSGTSETLLIALVALATFLIFAAAFFSRLTAITLPGGGGLTFTAAGQAVAAGALASVPAAGNEGRDLGQRTYAIAWARIKNYNDPENITEAELEAIFRNAFHAAQAQRATGRALS